MVNRHELSSAASSLGRGDPASRSLAPHHSQPYRQGTGHAYQDHLPHQIRSANRYFRCDHGTRVVPADINGLMAIIQKVG